MAQEGAFEAEIEVLPLTENERAEWRSTFTPVWREFEPVIGTDVIEAAGAAEGAAR